MKEPTYNPNAINELNETMGIEVRERMPCGVVIKNRSEDKGYAKSALGRMREDLKEGKK